MLYSGLRLPDVFLILQVQKTESYCFLEPVKTLNYIETPTNIKEQRNSHLHLDKILTSWFKSSHNFCLISSSSFTTFVAASKAQRQSITSTSYQMKREVQFINNINALTTKYLTNSHHAQQEIMSQIVHFHLRAINNIQ